SLEKTYNDGGGGWLVLCDEGQDYWVAVFGNRPKSAGWGLPCILARQSGTDCYARCLVPDFDGASSSHDSKEALWDKFYTAAPPRRRQSVEQYKIIKRACEASLSATGTTRRPSRSGSSARPSLISRQAPSEPRQLCFLSRRKRSSSLSGGIRCCRSTIASTHCSRPSHISRGHPCTAASSDTA